MGTVPVLLPHCPSPVRMPGTSLAASSPSPACGQRHRPCLQAHSPTRPGDRRPITKHLPLVPPGAWTPLRWPASTKPSVTHSQPEHPDDVQLPECSLLDSEVPRGSLPLSVPPPPPASSSQSVGDTPRARKRVSSGHPPAASHTAKACLLLDSSILQIPHGKLCPGRLCPLCSLTLVISLPDLSVGFQRMGAMVSFTSPNTQILSESFVDKSSVNHGAGHGHSQPGDPRCCPKSPPGQIHRPLCRR